MTVLSRLQRGRVGSAGTVGLIFAALLVLNVVLNPARLAPSGIFTTIGLAAPLILAALATTPSILSGGGGIDISIGPMMGLLNVLMVRYLFLGGLESPWVVVPVVLVAGTILGAANGFLVAYIRVQPIVATLGTYLIFIGLAVWVLPTPSGFAPDWLLRVGDTFSAFPLLLVAALWAVIYRRPLYRHLMAVGGSDKAAYTSGINVGVVRLFAYALGGLIAAVAALTLTALIGSGDPNIGPSLTLKALSAVAIGGVSFAGGRGGLTGAALGAMVIFMLDLALNSIGLSTFVLQMVFGIILVIAVVFNAILEARR